MALQLQNILTFFSHFASVQLQAFKKFKDTKEAMVATDKLINDMLPKTLQKFLNKHILSKDVQDTLAGKKWVLKCAERMDIELQV